ncbi:MAG TPA: hypothetical protein VLH56_16025, partial [Dissulfurispiraceae bacterium]|nr:hypothetical protein [Dissulfurispiraceae bacterium]
LDAKCTAKNDSLRGSRIEKLGSIHVRTSPEIDPAEPQRDFFSSLIGRHAPEEYCLNNDNMANNELKITMKSEQIRNKNNSRRVGPELFGQNQ